MTTSNVHGGTETFGPFHYSIDLGQGMTHRRKSKTRVYSHAVVVNARAGERAGSVLSFHLSGDRAGKAATGDALLVQFREVVAPGRRRGSFFEATAPWVAESPRAVEDREDAARDEAHTRDILHSATQAEVLDGQPPSASSTIDRASLEHCLGMLVRQVLRNGRTSDAPRVHTDAQYRKAKDLLLTTGVLELPRADAPKGTEARVSDSFRAQIRERRSGMSGSTIDTDPAYLGLWALQTILDLAGDGLTWDEAAAGLGATS